MTLSSVTIQITPESRPSTPSWMGKVAAFAQVLTHVGSRSAIQERVRFTAGLQRDKEEVLAGLTLVYSNGQVEGFVNKLKLIKRQGYGRAPTLRTPTNPHINKFH